MPGGWDPTVYRVRAEDWQDKADALPPVRNETPALRSRRAMPDWPS
jgi:hypothetical protein